MEHTAPPKAPVRASDTERERVLRDLREAVVLGRLTHDTFVRRLEVALRAKDRETLAAVTADLPTRGTRRRLGALWARAGGGIASWVASARAARPVPMRLPPRRHADYSIGRSPGCDVVVEDPTVSRVHAALRCFGDQWFLVDLGSTNGTRVNGFRARGSVAVVPGDLVALGRAVFRVQAVEPRRGRSPGATA